MSWELVKACTVAITTHNGEIRGAGFYISPKGHLLTCAHVVEAAGGWKQIRVNGHAVKLIDLGERTRDDFAILQTPSYTGRSVPLSTDFEPRDNFLSVGYGRPDFPEGASIDGVITDKNPHQKYNGFSMIRLRIQADSQRIKGGYSGSPVFNTKNKSVIGIIAASDHTEGALAVPFSEIREKLLLHNRLFRLQEETSPENQLNRFRKELSNLGEQLRNKQWKDADITTWQMVCRLAGHKNAREIYCNNCNNMDSSVLAEIDRIWHAEGDSHFGFSIQKKIYRGLGGSEGYDQKILDEFYRNVGWGKSLLYDERPDFQSARAPRGHLPARLFISNPRFCTK
ncbi:MAG: GUN4 domain-containing protein, partial [Bacteroidota bacterium]